MRCGRINRAVNFSCVDFGSQAKVRYQKKKTCHRKRNVSFKNKKAKLFRLGFLYQKSNYKLVTVASETTTATFARCLRLSFANIHSATAYLLTVQFVDSILSFFFSRHFDEAESLAATRITVHNDFS